jgi:hypothetical protein
LIPHVITFTVAKQSPKLTNELWMTDAGSYLEDMVDGILAHQVAQTLGE